MKHGTLVRNKAATPVAPFQSLICNVLPKNVRLETLEERSYTVVPMVMLTEGVHAGSSGPLLYTNEELAKTPIIWNHKPVVVYHPERDGVGLSACDPVILQNRKVGLILNASYEKSRLKAEAWIEKDRADKVDERIMAAVETNKMMELSTGLFVDMEESEGEFKGDPYVGIARNYRPDHLALLPDKIGACSIQKGAGFLRNQGEDKKGFSELRRHLTTMGLGHLATALTGNEMSFSNIQQSICAALMKKLGYDPQKGPWVWVADVYSDFFIYEYEGKLFRLGYDAADTGITIEDGKPAEVKRVTEYRTVEGAYVGNQDQPTENEDTTMDKTKMILAILAAGAASGWSENDRPALDKLSDAQIKSIHNGLTANASPPANTEAKKVLVDAIIANNQYGWVEGDRVALMAMNEQQLAKIKLTAPAAAPAAPAATAQPAAATTVTANSNQPQTLEQYISSAPPAMREVLNSSLDALQKEKGVLIEGITKNSNNPFSKDELGNMPIGDLRKLARLAYAPVAPVAGSTVPNYAGMAPVPVENAAVEEPLELPSMTFGK